MDLPLIDRHGITVEAPIDRVWAALRGYVDATLAGGDVTVLHRFLGTEPAHGFEVADEVPGQLLGLTGRHRFSRYRLDFEVAATNDPRTTVLSAATYAEFPGPQGSVYRALVIGSRAHVVAVRRMLRAVRRESLRT